MSKVVGIDLGTTNSLVAYVKDGVPLVIRDQQGDGLVPSVVSFADEGMIYVGREAYAIYVKRWLPWLYSLVVRRMKFPTRDPAHSGNAKAT